MRKRNIFIYIVFFLILAASIKFMLGGMYQLSALLLIIAYQVVIIRNQEKIADKMSRFYL